MTGLIAPGHMRGIDETTTMQGAGSMDTQAPGRPRRLLTVSLLLLAAFLPFDEAAAAEPSYIGKTYTGRVLAEIERDDLAIKQRHYGSASAEFTRLSDDKARLVLFGTIEKPGDAAMTVEGRYDESGFRATNGDLSITVNAAGTISGGGTVNNEQFRFEGKASDTDLDLRVSNSPAAGAKPSVIRGIDFTYEMETEAGAERRTGGKKCREIRYEMRPVANIGDGTMSMLSVPVCIE
jgi:hypothetical protein